MFVASSDQGVGDSVGSVIRVGNAFVGCGVGSTIKVGPLVAVDVAIGEDVAVGAGTVAVGSTTVREAVGELVGGGGVGVDVLMNGGK